MRWRSANGVGVGGGVAIGIGIEREDALWHSANLDAQGGLDFLSNGLPRSPSHRPELLKQGSFVIQPQSRRQSRRAFSREGASSRVGQSAASRRPSFPGFASRHRGL